jgi:aspartyl-tRNA(Asn)/glutamyl-tRNA(Gln) amidotransferase subunit A
MTISRRSFVAASIGTVLSPGISVTAEQSKGADLTDLTLQQVSDLIRRKKLSPVEVTEACLARIHKLNPLFNAFITVTADQAMDQARQAEREIQQGKWRGPLHGVPVSVKDLCDTAGVRTTAGSALFKDRVPEHDAEVVHRLKLAGAVLVGKTNMHEFAYGGTSVVSYFGAVHNPWNPDYIAGGSSGGSAAAVAARMCYGSIGSDTGGSIRQPAACCGLSGLKPTYGLVSTRGAIPLSWTVDHLGPIARTAEDAAVLLSAIAGYDPDEITSISMKVEDYPAVLKNALPKLRLGLARPFFFENLHPEIDGAIQKAISVLERLTGTTAREVKLDAATVDKIRVTVRAAEAYAYHAPYLANSTSLYAPYTLQRIQSGSRITATEYLQARRQLEQTRRATTQIFQSVDVFITPTMPAPTPAIAEVPSDPTPAIAMEAPLMRNTSPLDGYGLPSISIPCGFTRAGMPIGLQISGPMGSDATVLRLAHAFQQVTDWQTKSPKMPFA